MNGNALAIPLHRARVRTSLPRRPTRRPRFGDRFPMTRSPPTAAVLATSSLLRWLLLADEINRATPKTQSAMLEAMAERQVTVLGETHSLTPETPVSGSVGNVRPPFMVLATQNPIDQEGVFDLPEVQADRFMFKVRMPFPSAETLKRIVEKDAGLPGAKATGGREAHVAVRGGQSASHWSWTTHSLPHASRRRDETRVDYSRRST